MTAAAVGLARLMLAFRRARMPLTASAATYLGSAAVGIALVTAGVPFAVEQRDAVVGGAQGGPVLTADSRGDHLGAAGLDFASNLLLGSVPTSVLGLSVVGPFPIAAYRGWIGGIVSIDASHRSRLRDRAGAAYYLITLLAQMTGFVLTMAAGVHVGIAAWRSRSDLTVRSVVGLRIPRAVLADAGLLYAVAIPIFLAGSLWEFLA